MQKFINHVDHVAWIARPENLDMHIEQLERLTGATLNRFSRADMASPFASAGKRAPGGLANGGADRVQHLAVERARNQGRRRDLCGLRREGPRLAKARLAKMTIETGPLMDDHPSSPRHDKLVLWERVAGLATNRNIVLGDVDYEDGLIPFGPSDRPHSND